MRQKMFQDFYQLKENGYKNLLILDSLIHLGNLTLILINIAGGHIELMQEQTIRVGELII